MKCLNPTQCWKCGTIVTKSDGILSPYLVFSPNEALQYFCRISPNEHIAMEMMKKNEIQVPCGHCAACQIRKRKDYAVRLSHEAMMAQCSCFITLTYDDDHIPTTDWQKLHSHSKQFDTGFGSLPELTLIPSHVQKFMKRLRRHLEYIPKKGEKRDHVDGHIRYFAVGEYGSKTHRPHYHILIFGWSPSDKTLMKIHNGKPVYRSAQLEKLWKYGFSSVSDVNTFVAKYCARYVTKKFKRLQTDDGFAECIVPEFTLCSSRDGGIGSSWFDVYGESSLKTGFVNVRCGDRISRFAVPKYYYNRLRKRNLPLWLELRDQRIKFVSSHIGLPSSYDDVRRMVEVSQLADEFYSKKETF